MTSTYFSPLYGISENNPQVVFVTSAHGRPAMDLLNPALNALTSPASAKCEKAYSSSNAKPMKRRNRAAIRLAMSKAAGMHPASAATPEPDQVRQHEVPGLTLGQLEDQRWRISASTAREKLL